MLIFRRLYPWLGLMLLIVITALFIRLGLWQYQRGQLKASILTQQAKQAQRDPVLLQDKQAFSWFAERTAEDEFTVCQLIGQFTDDPIFYLDNQTMDGQLGYMIHWPFQIQQGPCILVNLGWIPAPLPRTQLPTLSRPSDQHIQGFLRIPSHNRFSKETWQPERTIPQKTQAIRVQNLDLSQFDKVLKQPLVKPWILVLKPTLDPSYTEPKALSSIMTPARHYGYAAQWFGFAVVLWLLLAMIWFKHRQ